MNGVDQGSVLPAQCGKMTNVLLCMHPYLHLHLGATLSPDLFSSVLCTEDKQCVNAWTCIP